MLVDIEFLNLDKSYAFLDIQSDRITFLETETGVSIVKLFPVIRAWALGKGALTLSIKHNKEVNKKFHNINTYTVIAERCGNV